jgi:hypothetical protein
MANLIIKSSANDLVIQGSDASPAITVGTAGLTTFAENATLSGTANNLGTVTTGTVGSGVLFPDNMPFYYKINKSSTLAGAVLSNSGSACGVGGFTGTLTHTSEIHELIVSFVKGGIHDSSVNKDPWNIGFQMLTAASPASNANGKATASLASGNLNNADSNTTMFYEAVGVSFTGTTTLTYGDAYWLPTITFQGVHTVTGTPGVTTYAYYPWWFNDAGSNTYVGRASSPTTLSPPSTLTLIKTKG